MVPARKAAVAGAMLLVLGTAGLLVGPAEAYRCGQSRPCAGGYNPYNPDSYNGVRAGAPALGLPGSAGGSFTKVVHPGQSAVLRWFYSIDPDCRSRGHQEIRLLSRPAGGTVQVRSGADFPAFPASNVRSACNTRRVPADEVVYRASPGFSGEDAFAVEVISPDHNARQVRFTVEVQ